MNSIADPGVVAGLDIGVQRLVGLVELCLDGSLDARTVDGLRQTLEGLLAEGALAIDVDCTELVDIDAFGLSLLLDVHRQLADRGGWLVLRYAEPAVVERVRAAGLAGVLTVAA